MTSSPLVEPLKHPPLLATVQVFSNGPSQSYNGGTLPLTANLSDQPHTHVRWNQEVRLGLGQ